MTLPSEEMKIGECVTNWPATARVFESYGVDYCCGGKQTIQSACNQSSLNLGQVLNQLESAISGQSTGTGNAEPQWSSHSLMELCRHIVETHHQYLRTELPRLSRLVDKVYKAHAASHPELAALSQAFKSLCDELMPHMMKEEQILFPAIVGLEQSVETPQFPFGTVQNPIRMMEHEHLHAGDELAQIRDITGQYTPPDDACPTYLAMLEGLHELERNMHQHVHKENNILFPRAIQLEQERRNEPLSSH